MNLFIKSRTQVYDEAIEIKLSFNLSVFYICISTGIFLDATYSVTQLFCIFRLLNVYIDKAQHSKS